ncbi:MAG TPA: DNA repair protein RecN [Candidatus Margulisiibacteriota bacterium]|nr:DNA repair protein RecN [Candidatus Margulisiibacteriota bacterium]
MLSELRISNVAIIDELQLTFAPGMNVLTGETGAGKSIIMRAIGVLCGDRAATDLIRGDAEEAEIEGLFDLADTGTEVLSDNGLPVSDELVMRRVIARSGKGRAYVNGRLATAAVLAQLGNRLLHVYGQHEHALLLKPESHLELLDLFARLDAPRAQMADAYAAFREAADRLAALTAGGEAARQRLELLRFQVKELRDAQLVCGEETQLQRERDVQRHAEKLTLICRQSEEALYSGDEAMAGGLARIAAQLQDAGRIAPAFGEQAEILRQAAAQVEEVGVQLQRAAERIRHDPQRLEQIEERLALLGRLKRKYDCEADTLLDRLVEMEDELTRIEEAGSDIAGARVETLARAGRAWDVAKELSRARQTAAAKLEKRMADELRTLGMKAAVLRVMFIVAASDGPQPGAHHLDPTDAVTAGLTTAGADVVQFYLSANPGEEPKPLARIASGGELSRVMLALKALTAGAGDVATLIFDEVDAGIGGAVAEAVGKRLQVLGRERQVLCITHLPQIAAQADHHFAVEKRVTKGRTTTTARALNADDRVRELARMLGDNAGAESERYARRLIEGGRSASR